MRRRIADRMVNGSDCLRRFKRTPHRQPPGGNTGARLPLATATFSNTPSLTARAIRRGASLSPRQGEGQRMLLRGVACPREAWAWGDFGVVRGASLSLVTVFASR
jgi:hypothetical protein